MYKAPKDSAVNRDIIRSVRTIKKSWLLVREKQPVVDMQPERVSFKSGTTEIRDRAEEMDTKRERLRPTEI